MMEHGLQVIGVGHSCLDRLCMIENYPNEDDSTHITSITVQGGGAVATALAAASRLGVKSGYIGNTGTDFVSDEILRLLEADGVYTGYVSRRSDAFGLESFVMVNPASGSRTKFPERDVNPPIEWTPELKDAIRNASILHLDGTNWENAYEAASIARDYGVMVSLDGCSMQSDNTRNRKLASMADCLIMNKKYPLRVTGVSDYDDALLEISSWGSGIVMCTLGEDGVKAVIDGQVESFPAFKINVVDTTGAGDVFHGAFIAGLLDGMDIRENIRFASAVAALKCTKAGGRAGIPDKEKALAFMNGNM